MLQLTPHQNIAFDKIMNHDFSKKSCYFGGFGGTGKSTMLINIAKELGEDVTFLAPTGKACQVLKSKMPKGTNVHTVHHILYQPVEITKQEIEELKLKPKSDAQAQKRLAFLQELMKGIGVEFHECIKTKLLGGLVVVDESSMLGQREHQILERSGCKIVYVGDPFQLQPVKSKQILPSSPQDFDAFLSEIHRAALDSPITRLSMELRNGNFRGWDIWNKEGIYVSRGAGLDEYRNCDQVLTGTNASRIGLNKHIRVEKEHHLPVEGDKLIIKQNEYAYGRDNMGRKTKWLRFVNGEIIYATRDKDFIMSWSEPEEKYEYYIPFTSNNIQYEQHVNDNLFCTTYGVTPKLNPKQGLKMDYAYAITVHSAQGSEWNDVIIYDDEMQKHDPKSRAHWMYTAVTRAKNSVKIVKPKK